MVKAFLLAALALVFIYGMEKISKDSLILLFPSDIVDLKDNLIGIQMSGFLFIASLTSIMHIIECPSSSNSYQLLIFFVYLFSMSFLN